jgi:hypothetical protein
MWGLLWGKSSYNKNILSLQTKIVWIGGGGVVQSQQIHVKSVLDTSYDMSSDNCTFTFMPDTY